MFLLCVMCTGIICSLHVQCETLIIQTPITSCHASSKLPPNTIYDFLVTKSFNYLHAKLIA